MAETYTKIGFVNQIKDANGNITTHGTKLNSDNMNHIETQYDSSKEYIDNRLTPINAQLDGIENGQYTQLNATTSITSMPNCVDGILDIAEIKGKTEVDSVNNIVKSVKNLELACVSEDESNKSNVLLQDILSEEIEEMCSIGDVADKIVKASDEYELEKYIYHIPLSEFVNFHSINKFPGGTRIIFNTQFSPKESSVIGYKYDGTALQLWSAGVLLDGIDENPTTKEIYIGIADTDSGWGDSYVPISDEIKAYFLGWRLYDTSTGTASPYNRTDGLNKRWAKIWCGIGQNDNGLISGSGQFEVPTVVNDQGYTPYQLFYQLAEPQTYKLNKIPNLNIYKNSSFQMEKKKKIILDGSFDWKMASEGLNNTICQPYITLPQNFESVENILNNQGLEMLVATDFIGNAYQILDNKLYLQIFKNDMGFDSSHVVTVEEVKDYINALPYSMKYETKPELSILPELIANYPINVGGAISSIAGGVENNSNSIENMWLNILIMADRQLALSGINSIPTDMSSNENENELKNKINEILNVF